jgi:hypothetical protein
MRRPPGGVLHRAGSRHVMKRTRADAAAAMLWRFWAGAHGRYQV